MNKIKAILQRRLGLKVTALFFAVLLWSYVISDTDPYRTKHVRNVALTAIGAESLDEQDLIIRGDGQSKFGTCDVNVEARISQMGNIGLENVTASVDLSGISEPGTFRLKVTAKTKYGEIQKTSPEYITVEVDDKVSTKVPVVYEFTGTLPQGYWNDTPEITPNEIEITGARTDVEKVTRAMCTIDLNNVTEDIKGSYNLKLVDSEGKEISATNFVGELPAATVEMKVLPYKAVALDVSNSISDAHRVARGYEVTSITSAPLTVEIAAPKEVLDTIQTLQVEMVSVRGLNADATLSTAVILPKNVTLITNPEIQIKVALRPVQ